MKRLHIIGRKNNGKTTLIVELIGALTARGLRIGTIKHTHHHHELDTPGKDSHRHRQAGAFCVGILSPELNAVFWPTSADAAGDSQYDLFADLQADCDLVLVEGDTQTSADKIEVWRQGVSGDPIAASESSILALISDDSVEVGCPTIKRHPPKDLIQWILDRMA